MSEIPSLKYIPGPFPLRVNTTSKLKIPLLNLSTDLCQIMMYYAKTPIQAELMMEGKGKPSSLLQRAELRLSSGVPPE